MKNLILTFLGITFTLFSYSQCQISLVSMNSILPNCTDSLTTTGEVTINANPPSSGYLIIENCQGVSDTITQAPFVIGTYPFSLNTEANGQNCDFTVFFTDDLSCQQVLNIDLLQAIGPDEAGTFSMSHSGNGIATPTMPDGNNFILCDQDQFYFNSNDDFDIPDLSPNTAEPNDFYDPGIIYMVYSCPPTVSGMGTIPWINDPCWVGILNEGDDLVLTNNGGSSDPMVGAFLNSNNEFYIVPMTFYDKTNIYTHADCYDLSIEDVQHLQYLNPIEFSSTQTCISDTAEITITGGYPEFYPATEYTASNLSAGFFVNSTCGHNGTIEIAGLSPGEIFSFDIIDENGCPVTYTNLPNSGSDSTIVVCEGDLDSLILNNYLDGLTSGVWDNPYPEFDSLSSVLQLDGLLGSYNFTYQVGDSCFHSSSYFTVEIVANSNAGDDSSIVIPNVVTVDLDDYLTGDLNGSWTPYVFSGLGSFDHTTGMLNASGLDTGDYVFEYIVDSCGLDTAYIYVHVDPFAGINESFIDEISLYPNPAYDIININCTVCTPLKIIDVNGKMVQLLNGDKKVDISNISPGMYYSIIQSSSGEIKSIKFLVK